MKKHHWWCGSLWPSISQRYVTLNQRMRRWSKSFVAFPYPFCQDSTALRHSCATSFGWPIHHISLWQETKWALNRGELPRLAACPLADLAIEHWPFGWALATCRNMPQAPGYAHRDTWKKPLVSVVGWCRQWSGASRNSGMFVFCGICFFFWNQYVDSLLFHLISASIVRWCHPRGGHFLEYHGYPGLGSLRKSW